MKLAIITVAIAIASFGCATSQKPSVESTSLEVAASPKDGFSWPYLLYVPDSIVKNVPARILVIPINTGSSNDSFDFHRQSAKEGFDAMKPLADKLAVVELMPIFPRPHRDEMWRIYTQALDRDTLALKDGSDLVRLDLQLLSMIEDAQKRLAIQGVRTHERVFMWGFSAAAMFANRFGVLHPERVEAAAIGSPGGWPIAPVKKYKGNDLRYPLGISDIKAITGEEPNSEAFKNVSWFFYLGDQDENDSLVYEDGYDKEDRNLAFKLLGKTPKERWDVAKEIYSSVTSKAEFKLYPGIGHRAVPSGKDLIGFFRGHK